MIPDSGTEYYDDGCCEVKDNTDYYFDDDLDDMAEVSDTNDYYSIGNQI